MDGHHKLPNVAAAAAVAVTAVAGAVAHQTSVAGSGSVDHNRCCCWPRSRNSQCGIETYRAGRDRVQG